MAEKYSKISSFVLYARFSKSRFRFVPNVSYIEFASFPIKYLMFSIVFEFYNAVFSFNDTSGEKMFLFSIIK